ncbi:DEAD/DEAH box helicase [Pseudarthrobacter sp. AL07]|uniref:DUF3427 domain-containing protein n=2 Tax=Micrococcaceae TaxID=1268 RepID=UPI00249C8A1E|nr:MULTISPECIES: DEAD/DEAH box helicase [unclassified Pseudarthrobacter]MDI3195684.1 DEAD/DEAH box helicase [Pseudarthrobacter sp. AL20]MDI3209767.1 DEAD/DEAH box helicase [Pseudarthrobacter sp. AL07]
MADFIWDSAPLVLEQDVRFGYLNRSVSSPRQFSPEIVFNTKGNTMLRVLRQNLRKCTSFTFSVAFVSPRAIALLKQELAEFSGTGRIITSDYLGFNSPDAFSELLNLSRPNKFFRASIDVRLHHRSDFHPKGYVFHHSDNVTAILGSSNLTENALVKNHEWNLKVSAAHRSDLAGQLHELLSSEVQNSDVLTAEWIEQYREVYQSPRMDLRMGSRRGLRRPAAPSADGAEDEPTSLPVDEDLPLLKTVVPNSMQQAALAAIHTMRLDGKDKALVISATGTGKTILSALDVRHVNPQRMLFVVHREQILDRAIQEFQLVLGAHAADFGKLAARSRNLHTKYVFATVQTLSQPEVMKELAPDAFDYILVDEVHRAGAESYRRILDHFKPKFLLGVTATPERSDGINIYEIFDFNVPYEIRLNHALEEDMLSPFHYYGIADVEFSNGTAPAEPHCLARLTSDDRVSHVLEAIALYGQAGVAPRGLIFCSRKDEAARLSEQLNQRSLRGRPLRTVALTGEDPVARREEQVVRLERGELDYILTVDIFNEGVDIPSINQVIMLRQTQSAIVFVQQLGRGLRKHPDKEYVVVIDFIGNYANNYLIPIALFGDESLNKESLRQNLIAAEESGVLPGLSSVRFDRISQERVLQSIVDTTLDKLQNIKAAFEALKNRLGGNPQLMDFYRFESVDPVLLATRDDNYPALVYRLTKTSSGITPAQNCLLALLSYEVLPAKRLHETVLLRELLTTGQLTIAEMASIFTRHGIAADLAHVRSAVRSLTMDFNTDSERSKYLAAVKWLDDETVGLTPELDDNYSSSQFFSASVDDVLDTAYALISDRYADGDPFMVGKQYSRKDASRLLCWQKNVMSTIYGYKVDRPTMSCPIFVTYHKSEGVTASIDYGDELLDHSTMRWFTRSRRRLTSGEVVPIVDNNVALHVFIKKDDNDGADFFYLGRARSQDAIEATMPNDPKLSVVQMDLKFESPVLPEIYDYFKRPITSE